MFEFTDKIVYVDVNFVSYHCDPECLLTVHKQTSFAAPAEMIEGERNCVDVLDINPEGYSYNV